MGAQRPKPTAYLPMYAGFCDTTTARQVTRRLGDAGFHAYVRLLCILLNEPGGRLPLALDDEWDDLSDRLGVDVDAAKALVALMEHYGVLEVGEGYVFSPDVSESIAIAEAAREYGAAGGRKSAEVRRRKAEEAANA
jgi:hypothetical protein